MAVRVARLYYFQNMTTAAIADEIGTSRATVSRASSPVRNPRPSGE